MFGIQYSRIVQNGGTVIPSFIQNLGGWEPMIGITVCGLTLPATTSCMAQFYAQTKMNIALFLILTRRFHIAKPFHSEVMAAKLFHSDVMV